MNLLHFHREIRQIFHNLASKFWVIALFMSIVAAGDVSAEAADLPVPVAVGVPK
jgi:hypothetical protein